ncbi:beta-propeller fold lactonase family protein [Candidatus Latescibacterota bacterium]
MKIFKTPFLQIVVFLSIILIIISCSERERSNPLDAQGVSKGEDLFGLVATPGNNCINLKWSEYDFDNIENFKIYRSDDSTSTFNVIARPSNPSYSDSLSTGYEKLLYYKVSMVIGGVESDFSNSVSASPLDITPPVILFTNLEENEVISGKHQIETEGSDNSRFSHMQFFIDDVLASADSIAPYNYLWDTIQLEENSTHQVKIIGWDTYGNSISSARSVTVRNAIPKIVSVAIDDSDEIVGLGTLAFTIIFDSDMDVSINPTVTFGILSPYNTHSISGNWEADRKKWIGTFTIDETIENGSNILSVKNAKSKSEIMILNYNSFDFLIDTVSPQSAKITINQNDTYTSSEEISLQLSVLDATSGVSDMMIANESLFSGAGWEPYAETKIWNLTSGDGTKTVYVKFRDAAGNISGTVSDIIISNLSAPQAVTLNLAEIQEDGVLLSWTQNTDNDFFSYEVRRSSLPGVSTSSTIIKIINNKETITYIDITVEADKTYYYRIFVYDIAGLTTGSNEMKSGTDTEPTPDRGINGMVTDKISGTPLSGVEVSISPEISPLKITNSAGEYIFDGFSDTGDYTLTFSKEGFTPLSATVTVQDIGYTVQNVSLLSFPSVKDFVSPGSFSFSNPQYIALSADGKRGYVTDSEQGVVAVLDVSSNSVIAQIDVGSGPLGVATSPVFNQVFVANTLSNDVSVIDGTTNQEIRKIDVGNHPSAICVTPDGENVLVTNKEDNSVSVIKIGTYTVTHTISVGTGPQGIIILPDGSEAYVSNSEQNTVSVINLSSMSVVKTIFVSSGPLPLAVSSDGSKVYVANRFANSVSVIDVSSKTVEKTIPVGEFPVGLAVAPEGDYEGYLYVLNYSNSNMMIVDTSSYIVSEQTVSLGNYPVSLVITPDGAKMFAVNDVNANVMVVEY